MTEAYIGLGSNLGDRLVKLDQARALLAELPETCVIRQSLVYETQPVGPVSQGDYLNQVVVLQTSLAANDLLQRLQAIEHLLQRLQAIEHRLHRQRLLRWGARAIDLDLLIYEGLQLQTPELTLPHPEIANRRFVLVPLLEVAAGPLVAEVVALLKKTPDYNWVRLVTTMQKEDSHGSATD